MINSITITQDNKVNGSDLVPIHSPLVFLADANFTGDYPTALYVDVIDGSTLIDTFKAIPYTDVLANVRRFAFVATDVIKPLLGNFDDFHQLNNTLAYVNGMTRVLTLRFYDPANNATEAETTCTFVHGAAQFGDNPNFDTIYNNAASTYYGPDGKIVYIYFYNNDITNILTIDSPTTLIDYAADFDDAIFDDYDDEPFEIEVTP